MGQPERSSFVSRFELNYVRPALKIGTAYFNDRPILTTFLAIFFVFSILPVLAFLGIGLFVIISFNLIALAVVFIASSAVILGLFAILVAILLGALFASAFFTFMAISAYILLRLVVLVREDGVSGVSGWACEMKSHILNNSAYGYHAQAQDDRSESNESVVVVHEPEARSSDYHDESDYNVKVQC
ncbi:hypothetical protein BYT27DRAFT_7189808 [Phlegmacium glaucopus]|nr:hypothetical protein BYT27DRAFT_7189808 [Phlegmacium glaucopus]